MSPPTDPREEKDFATLLAEGLHERAKERAELQSTNSKLTAEIAELKESMERHAELHRKASAYALKVRDDSLARAEKAERELDTLRAEFEALKGRAQDVSQEEANELQAILRTLAPSGRALVHSARQLVELWEKQTSELASARKERDEAKEEFRKAAEWNRLTELELTNLRSLNADLSQDIDSIDMLRDEFRRIKVCSGVTDEIKGLCERALLDIKQKVPVIEQRDAAETQRNAALRDAMDALEEVESLTVQLTSALAAKDEAEKKVAYVIDALKRWNDDRLKRVDEAEAEATKWKAENDMYGWNYHQGIAAGLNFADIMMPKGFSDLRRFAALIPAPTQEPPAGGVTISNDSSRVEGHAEAEGRPGYMGNAQPSEYQASPAVTPSNSPADVPSVGRGEWMPIETAPKDGTYLLLLGDSGYLTTPWRVNVGAWKPGFRDAWVDHANDRITDGGTEPTHWLPLDAFMLPTEGSGA